MAMAWDMVVDEESEDLDADMHSPTDGSEDSIDVKVKPIRGFVSKRKCSEPRKFDEGPKCHTLDRVENPKKHKERSKSTPSHDNEPESPFRPWSRRERVREYSFNDQEQPLSLVLREEPSDAVLERLMPPSDSKIEQRPQLLSKTYPKFDIQLDLADRSNLTSHGKSRPRPQEVVRLPAVSEPSTSQNPVSGDCKSRFSVESLINSPGLSSSPASEKRSSDQQRNYKNMTKERRIEANARERTRVHTISAAFDTLRRAVPAYSHNQKLSKLSVLRIACSYILTLSRVAGMDYSEDSSRPALSDCVDHVTRTIQLEGKLRKKKDD